MKLAWVSHHLPRETDSPHAFHLPGQYVGGAEMTDATLRAAAPDGIDIEIVPPHLAQMALECDDIVITGTDHLSDASMMLLADQKPAVFLHHEQTPSAGRKYLLENARTVIVHTPAHYEIEKRWSVPNNVQYALSPLDPSECWIEEPKLEQAVWANRMHDLKGPRAAAMWAAKNDIPLVRLSNVPRSEVLQALAVSRYFVHLPLGFESESRATIEAVLSGCEIIANDNVGITSVPGWDDRERLTDMLSTAAETWWNHVIH